MFYFQQVVFFLSLNTFLTVIALYKYTDSIVQVNYYRTRQRSSTSEELQLNYAAREITE